MSLITCRLSIVQIVLGILSIAAQAGALHIERVLHWRRSGTLEYHGYGFWCGALYGISGILGICAVLANSRKAVAACLSFNIICILVCSSQLVYSAINLTQLSDCQILVDDKYRTPLPPTTDYYNSGSNGGRTSSTAAPYDYCTDVLYLAWMTIDTFQLAFALVEFVIAIMTTNDVMRKKYP